jgi:hypothetical protein
MFGGEARHIVTPKDYRTAVNVVRGFQWCGQSTEESELVSRAVEDAFVAFFSLKAGPFDEDCFRRSCKGRK